jgi:hypothetical protein
LLLQDLRSIKKTAKQTEFDYNIKYINKIYFSFHGRAEMLKGTLFSFALLLSIVSSYSNISRTIEPADISITTADGYAIFMGTPVYGEPGEPVLPSYTYTFLVSPDADLQSVKVSITGLTTEVLAGEFNVRPGAPLAIQNKVIWPEGKTIVNGKDVAVYSKNSFFPGSHVSVSTAGMMRRYKLVQVEINPILYNPVTKRLKKMTGGSLRVNYVNLPGNPSRKGTIYKTPVGVTKMVKKLVDNYSEMANAYADFKGDRNGGLAIITTDDIQSGSQQLTAFISHKEMRGYTVTVETASNWSTSEIRSWIKDNYESLNIEYLMLIGDPTPSGGDVPMYKTGSTPTDWYYAELSGSGISSSDVTAEVHVGRIPVYSSGDIQELDKILEKTMLYENTPEEEIGWRFKVLLSMKPIDSRTQAYELGEQIKDSTLVRCGWEYYRIYDEDYNLSPPPEKTPVTSSNTQNAWKNEQPGCVFWDTHGSSTSSSGMISVSDVSDLDDTHPVFTFQGACLNAKPDVDNNLCYALLQHGAIAANGGTISVTYSPGETDYTNTGSIGGQNYWYAEALIRDSLPTAAANDYARVKINGKKWANHCALALYGDPTVSPYSCEVNSNPYIRVNVPNGGEEWEQFSTQRIRWSDNILGNVKIELYENGSVKEVLAASVESNGAWTWDIPENYPLGNTFKIRVTSVDSSALWEESDEVFSIIPEFIIVCPYFQNFDTLQAQSEDLPYKYEQLTDDDRDWTVYKGPTPSRIDDPPDVTGPMADHTTGTDQTNYLYTEASASNNGNPNKVFTFVTPKFNFKGIGNPELSFWYHMLSDNSGEDHMGDLLVDISVDGTWQNDVIKISGNKGDNWLEQKLDLTPHIGDRVIFRFRGITGDSWESDICIDDLRINGTVPNINPTVQTTASFNLNFSDSRIQYRIPEHVSKNSTVTIGLYNLQGKLIKTLVHETKKAGNYSINLKNKTYRPASGLYLVKMEVANFNKTIKIINK